MGSSIIGRIRNEIPVKQFGATLLGLVDGHCPVDICGASCCQSDAWTGEEGPCSQLDDKLECKLQKGIHGKAMKPHYCVVWPANQEDIDRFNAAGGNCQLRYE